MTPFVPIEKQDVENLTYPDDSFDIVCVNALDKRKPIEGYSGNAEFVNQEDSCI